MSFQDSCLLSSVFDLYLSVSFYPISLSLYSRPFKNCDPDKEQTAFYSSFREFLLWPGLEVHEPECTHHEQSEYEKLRNARINANQEFLRGLWLAEAFLASVRVNHFLMVFLWFSYVVFLGFLMAYGFLIVFL